MTATIWNPAEASEVNANTTIIPQYFSATQGQTVFTISAFTYTTGTNSLFVFVNGEHQLSGIDYNETDEDEITFINGLNAGDVVAILGFVGITAELTGGGDGGGGVYLTSISAIGDAFTASPVGYTAYAAGDVIRFVVPAGFAGNTGAATINLNGLGAQTIVDLEGATLADNAIVEDMLATLVYDGTNFRYSGQSNVISSSTDITLSAGDDIFITAVDDIVVTGDSVDFDTDLVEITGASARLRGDLSNATISQRLLAQTTTTNGKSDLGIIPNGTSVVSAYTTYADASPTNAAYTQLGIDATSSHVTAGENGSGVSKHLELRVDSTGNEDYVSIEGGNLVIGGASSLPSNYDDSDTSLGGVIFLGDGAMNISGNLGFLSAGGNFITGAGPTYTVADGSVKPFRILFDSDRFVFEKSESTVTGDPVTFVETFEISTAQASPVNRFKVYPGATTTGPRLHAVGSDTNISMHIISKGTGNINFQTMGANSDTEGSNTWERQFQVRNLGGASAAVNYLYAKGAVTGDDPVLGADGTGTNIDISLAPKGTGTVLSAKAAAADYLRIAVNQCVRTANFSRTTLTAGNTTVAAPTGAVAVVVNIKCEAQSANGSNTQRYARVISRYSGSDIATVCSAEAREVSAVSTGNTLCETTCDVVIPVESGNFVLRAEYDAGGYSEAGYGIVGYFD